MKRFLPSVLLLLAVVVAAPGVAAPRGSRKATRAPRITVATWNGNWFPSGRAEHRAHPDVEAATTVAAGKMLAASLRAADPTGSNAVILVLNEIRGPRSVSNLIERIGIPGLRLASISAYRRRDRFDAQQDVIATTLPVVDHGWSTWRSEKRETPPRGYARAQIVFSPAVTATVYSPLATMPLSILMLDELLEHPETTNRAPKTSSDANTSAAILFMTISPSFQSAGVSVSGIEP